MRTGIYALFWESQGLVYVGQSQTIEKRYRDHLVALSKGMHANYKVANAYNLYGEPSLVVLEECAIEDLYSLEILWTAEFNSLVDGLNIIEPGVSGWGVNSSRARYSKFQVLKTFSMLYNTSLACIDISKKLNVSLRLVEAIKGGYSHTWLKDEYPDKYKKMQERANVKSTFSRRAGKIFVLKNIYTGEEAEIDSVANFTKSLFGNDIGSFSSGIRRVLRKEQTLFKGWALKQNYDILKQKI